MNRILKNPSYFLDIISSLTNYDCNISFKKTVEKLDFEEVYDEVCDFIDAIDDALDSLDKYIDDENVDDLKISYRIKTEQSLQLKWNKNLDMKRPLKKVANDIIGIRIVTDLSSEEMKDIDFSMLESDKIKIVNFHECPKTVDDGYRGIHIYYRESSRCFPVEIQIWNKEDAIINFYTHEVIYKRLNLKKSALYGKDLRDWIEKMPIKPPELEVSLLAFLYNTMYRIGGDANE